MTRPTRWNQSKTCRSQACGARWHGLQIALNGLAGAKAKPGSSQGQRRHHHTRPHHSHRSALDAALEFIAAEGSALVPLTDRIGRQRGIGLERFVAVVLGAASWPIAETKGLRIVPEAARIVGRAVEDLADNVRMLEADPDQLREVLRLEPDRQSPLVGGRVADVADADRGRAQSMLVGVERGERLAECLAHAIARIRPHRGIGPDAALAWIETNGVIG